jgi:hypothetical protein
MAGIRTSASTMARSSTISQPTAILPRSVSTSRRSWSARSSTTVLATDSARPKTKPPQPQPSKAARPSAEQVATPICDDRAGDGDGADREQVLQREMQADAEHQQDDADLGQFVGEILIGDITGREGPDGDAGEEIADQGRKAQLWQALRR